MLIITSDPLIQGLALALVSVQIQILFFKVLVLVMKFYQYLFEIK